MVNNEHTSEQIATFASEILKIDQPLLMSDDLWKKVKAVAGSALTQAPDKPTNTKSLLEAYKKQKQYLPSSIKIPSKFDAAKAYLEVLKQNQF